MIDWTKPIETKDGEPARVLATDLDNGVYPVAISYKNCFEREFIAQVTREGKSSLITDVAFIRNKKQKVWINLYTYKNKTTSEVVGFRHLTREGAKDCPLCKNKAIQGLLEFLSVVEVDI